MSDDPYLDLVCNVVAPLLPDRPWLGWLAVALCRQRARQAWLVQVRDTHLADVDEDQGDVPDLPGWTYDFHGQGLCLAGPDGEYLDVDFYDDPSPGATIDPYFFAGRLRSLPEPALPEARTRELLRSSDLVHTGLEALRRVGAIHHPSSRHVFHLSPRLEAHHRAIAAIDFADPDTARRWARALGDADRGRTLNAFRQWITEMMQRDRSAARNLPDLAPLFRPEALQQLALGVLSGPVDAHTGRALDALRATRLAPAPEVVALLDRLDPERHHPYPCHALTAYLLDHGLERARCLEAIERFAEVEAVPGYRGNPYLDHLATLLLEHAGTDRAWPVLRHAVFDGTPAGYERIGALLAVLDDDRAPRLLLEAAMAGDDTKKRFLVACLASRDDDASRALAREHMPPAPERSGAIGYSFEEVQYASLRSDIDARLTAARETLARLRRH